MNLYIIETVVFDRTDIFTVSANNISEAIKTIKDYMVNNGHIHYSAINLEKKTTKFQVCKGILNTTQPEVINYRYFITYT